MTATQTIALDVMGGDHGARVVLPGAALSLARHPDTHYILFGDEAVIRKELALHRGLAGKCAKWASAGPGAGW